jgi:carboxyl-terminal processing protease
LRHDRDQIFTSYGKGLVQSQYRLDGGYFLKLTTGKWYTPSGRSIHRERRITDDGHIVEGRLEDGKIIEGAPDSMETDQSRAKRPQFRSDAGRVVYGGGGIVPDLLVREDTMSTLQQEFMRSIAPKDEQIAGVLRKYALDLRDQVSRDFTITPALDAELRRRLRATGVSIDARYDSVATTLLAQDLDRLVARRAFGDAEAKKRTLKDDHPLRRAIELLQQSHSQQDLFRIAVAGAVMATRAAR